MPNKRRVEPWMLEALRTLRVLSQPGGRFIPAPHGMSNTTLRALAKLSWVEVRVTKTYGGTSPDGKTNLFNARITKGGVGVVDAMEAAPKQA